MTISILLIRPQLGENIGAAARVMKNFGFTDLRIVAPRDGWPNPAAESMAAGGLDVLQAATLYETTADAVADLNYVYATTAREREMEKPAIDSRALKKHASQFLSGGDAVVRDSQQRPPLVSSNRPENADSMSAPALSPSHREGQEAEVGDSQKIGVMFGPERSGLENEDIACADMIVSVPVNPDYPSLNLAQTVALICYELSQGPSSTEPERASLAEKSELFGLFDHLEAELDARNFWKVAQKKPQMWINIRNLLTRAELTDQEVRTLRGIVRCLADR